MAVVRHISPTPAPKGVKAWLKRALQRARTPATPNDKSGLAKIIVSSLIICACVVIALIALPWSEISKFWLVTAVLAGCIPVIAFIFLFRAQYMLRRAFVATLGVVVAKSWLGNTKGNLTVGELPGGMTVTMMVVLGFSFITAVVEAVLFSKPST
ncbi:hypothetical protein ILFOPFJJ_07023 [Ensifer psoraleae]|uniref:hypothetical protein n=1 Tax=Sinorhizobium psoraleae TaxID=520838 RepID=UPI001569C320|nr:hypothetical protein [Sinorhizobium psoraleae]NRP76099.1 hypothetical protein [Sinorhizobium psoraleae]